MIYKELGNGRAVRIVTERKKKKNWRLRRKTTVVSEEKGKQSGGVK